MNVLLRNAKCALKCNLAGSNVNKFNRCIYPAAQLVSKRRVSTAENEQWRIIYKLPLIRLASAFNRLKLYQAAFTVVSVPVSKLLVDMNHMPQESIAVVATVGFTGFITLTLCSLAFKNLVGLIYVNQQGDSIKLAYIDFWGRRQHMVTKIDKLVPDWDIKTSKYAYYQPIKTTDNAKETYKLVQRFGVITETHIFASLFGD